MNFIKAIPCLMSMIVFSSLHANVNSYFNQIKNDPNALYAFLKEMPKGGELHYHLAGGPYPETMLKLAATNKYCLNPDTLAMIKAPDMCNGIVSKDIANQPELYAEIVRSWSMKDFIPGKESGHDHFFSGFMKYMPLVFDYRPQLIADVMQRAANQNELYLELLDLPDNANSTNFGNLIKNVSSNAEKRKILLSNKEFQKNIEQTLNEGDRVIAQAYNLTGCKTNPNIPACKVQVKFLYYILREQPLDNMFAQAVNAFETVSRSKGNFVGINLVQPEDGIISLRDYRQHMLILSYLHGVYPNVNITLHAGELAPQAVVPEELRFHIHDALFTAHAQRIGHGVDIGYEDNSRESLNYMAKNQIPVEINLISNKKILNISGRQHPLNYYLTHNVPVVLSTDDEGVLRTDLTSQYVEAVIAHGLDYQFLKQINRNALTYAFIKGKSIWADATKGEFVTECQDLKSKTCQQFINQNEKAKLQWQLEQQLNDFESMFGQ